MKAASILKKALYDMRKKRGNIGYVFMGAENWARMLKKWKSKEWKKKSKAGRKARKSAKGKGRAVYTGGSVSTAVHKSRMVSIYSYK